MAVGVPMDFGCKNKLDNLYRISKSQGKLEWLKEVRSNDIKLQQVLVGYKCWRWRRLLPL